MTNAPEQDARHTADGFRRTMWVQALPYIRYAFLSGGILFFAFWIWDFRIDPAGAQRTLPIRLAVLIFYAALYALLTLVPAVRSRPMAAYVVGILMAPVFLTGIGLLLANGELLGHGSIVLVILIVGMVGPYDRVSIPLAIVVATLPNLVVFALILAGSTLPGLPVLDVAVNIAFLHAGSALLVAVLAHADTRRQRLLYDAYVILERSAVTDPLTGAANRRGLQAAFEREATRQKRLGKPTALLMFDIDQFKRINDTCGHRAGDEVLRELTRRLRAGLREIDTLARIGGEEFVAVLPATDEAGAMLAAERLRAAVDGRRFATSTGNIAVSISVGATVTGPVGADLDRLLHVVDGALYAAKDAGRNRCTFVPTPSA